MDRSIQPKNGTEWKERRNRRKWDIFTRFIQIRERFLEQNKADLKKTKKLYQKYHY